ncbi:MAG: anthranilate phosphoribosyltransferase [Armatimonadetes bacterium]|nr:anthranilate phosphoribosyltransferase [Armatimonadota bacterium]MDE2207997.1 anthranilate phosphoribosyltransferase [Armatimonadota bacterium]
MPADLDAGNYLQRLIEGPPLERSDARALAGLLMDGGATASQIGGLLTALRVSGESPQIAAGFVDAMRQRAVTIRPHRQPLLDTCGTGGAKCRVFNVSTCAALVAAAAGATVAKHGNRAATGICGSADVLEALGVNIQMAPGDTASCIDAIGIGFLFAPAYHPATRAVAGPRRELGIRTIFNLIGPLTNPAGASLQLMGVYDSSLCGLAIAALKELGIDRAIVVHGEDGLDEISSFGPTQVHELRDGDIRQYTLTREALALAGSPPPLQLLAPARSAEENAQIVQKVLQMGAAPTPAVAAQRELVAVNAAACLRLCDLASSWPEATEAAMAVMESGAAWEKLEQLAAFGRVHKADSDVP